MITNKIGLHPRTVADLTLHNYLACDDQILKFFASTYMTKHSEFGTCVRLPAASQKLDAGLPALDEQAKVADAFQVNQQFWLLISR